MKKYKANLIQRFGRKIKYAAGPMRNQVLKTVSDDLNDMPVGESLTIEFVRFE